MYIYIYIYICMYVFTENKYLNPKLGGPGRGALRTAFWASAVERFRALCGADLGT